MLIRYNGIRLYATISGLITAINSHLGHIPRTLFADLRKFETECKSVWYNTGTCAHAKDAGTKYVILTVDTVIVNSSPYSII